MNNNDDVFLKQMRGVSPIKKNNRVKNEEPKKNHTTIKKNTRTAACHPACPSLCLSFVLSVLRSLARSSLGFSLALSLSLPPSLPPLLPPRCSPRPPSGGGSPAGGGEARGEHAGHCTVLLGVHTHPCKPNSFISQKHESSFYDIKSMFRNHCPPN